MDPTIFHNPAAPATIADPAADPVALDLARVFAKAASSRYGIPIDDAEGAAMLGLVRAARRYDAGMGEFCRFANPYIRGAIADHARKWRPGGKSKARPCVVSLFAGPGEDPSGVFGLIAGPDGGPDAIDSGDWMSRAFRCLPPRHAELMRMVFAADGCAADVAATRMGLGKSRGFQLQREALTMLRANAARLGLVAGEGGAA